jgi:hypothetical protein
MSKRPTWFTRQVTGTCAERLYQRDNDVTVVCERPYASGEVGDRRRKAFRAMVRAVECHDDIVGALRDCADAIGGFLGCCDEREIKDGFRELDSAHKKARAAIAKAERESQ